MQQNDAFEQPVVPSAVSRCLIRITPSLAKELDRAANKYETNRTSLIRQVLWAYVEQQKIGAVHAD